MPIKKALVFVHHLLPLAFCLSTSAATVELHRSFEYEQSQAPTPACNTRHEPPSSQLSGPELGSEATGYVSKALSLCVLLKKALVVAYKHPLKTLTLLLALQGTGPYPQLSCAEALSVTNLNQNKSYMVGSNSTVGISRMSVNGTGPFNAILTTPVKEAGFLGLPSDRLRKRYLIYGGTAYEFYGEQFGLVFVPNDTFLLAMRPDLVPIYSKVDDLGEPGSTLNGSIIINLRYPLTSTPGTVTPTGVPTSKPSTVVGLTNTTATVSPIRTLPSTKMIPTSSSTTAYDRRKSSIEITNLPQILTYTTINDTIRLLPIEVTAACPCQLTLAYNGPFLSREAFPFISYKNATKLRSVSLLINSSTDASSFFAEVFLTADSSYVPSADEAKGRIFLEVYVYLVDAAGLNAFNLRRGLIEVRPAALNYTPIVATNLVQNLTYEPEFPNPTPLLPISFTAACPCNLTFTTDAFYPGALYQFGGVTVNGSLILSTIQFNAPSTEQPYYIAKFSFSDSLAVSQFLSSLFLAPACPKDLRRDRPVGASLDIYIRDSTYPSIGGDVNGRVKLEANWINGVSNYTIPPRCTMTTESVSSSSSQLPTSFTTVSLAPTTTASTASESSLELTTSSVTTTVPVVETSLRRTTVREGTQLSASAADLSSDHSIIILGTAVGGGAVACGLLAGLIAYKRGVCGKPKKSVSNRDGDHELALQARTVEEPDSSLGVHRRDSRENTYVDRAGIPGVHDNAGYQNLPLKSKYEQIIPRTQFDYDYAFTNLHKAARKGACDLIDIFLQFGVPVDMVNEEGYTPLQLASMEGHLDASKLLIARFADKNLTNRDNKTALDLARERGHKEIISFLEASSQYRPLPDS